MRWGVALLVAAAAFNAARGPRLPSLRERVGRYLRPRSFSPGPPPADPTFHVLRQAGLLWTRRQLLVRRYLAAGVGAFGGILLAQGDLFLTGTPRSLPGLTALGAAAGWLAFSIWITRRRERRGEALRQELPTAADTLALQIVAGESVASAIESFVSIASGVTSDELAEAVADHRAGAGLPEALAKAGRETANPEAGRLYHLLGHGHTAGGRLAESLAQLAIDYRAALARDMTSEGGYRALATYGPILALMIPTAVVFLMYPTLVSLRQLAGGP